MYALIIKGFWWRKLKLNNMSRFKHSERIPNHKPNEIDITNFTVEQLHLLIHNCNVFGIKDEIKQRYINKLNELENKNNKDE